MFLRGKYRCLFMYFNFIVFSYSIKLLFIFYVFVCMPRCVYRSDINSLESIFSVHHVVMLDGNVFICLPQWPRFYSYEWKNSWLIRSLIWGGSTGKRCFHSLTTLVQSQDPHGRTFHGGGVPWLPLAHAVALVQTHNK